MALSFFTSISFINNRTNKSFPVISKPGSLPISCSLTSSSISSKFPMASATNHDLTLGHKWLDYSPSKLPDKNYVRIFDTTLRDGEQAPGAALTPSQKIEIARQLAKLRVDIIEVGFPVSSKEDFETIKTIAKTVGNEVDEKTGYIPVLDVLSRCNRTDIETAWESVKDAKRPSITVFIATSDIHMKYKLKKTKKEVIEMAVNGVKYAKSLGFENIIFGCEDACRSEKEFLYEIMGETIKAGATTVGIADTVGITMPHEFGKFVSDVLANTPGIENVVFAVHCHNDLGVATANTLAAACAGARHLEVTINGIGERSGNAALEEVVMAMKCRGEYVMNGLYTNIDTKQIMATSKMVQEYTGLHVQAHKPIVGVNCFLHESGLHQDGMLKNRSTYEILSPEDIGIDTTNKSGFVLGKLSGRRALKDRLKELGYEIEDTKLNDIFSRFKELANQTKRITDADLKKLMVETNNIKREVALT